MPSAARTILPKLVTALLFLGCLPPSRAEPPERQVVFVCEHGNVKSLMAASFFNRIAQQRGLPYRAVARGSAPDSTMVPAPIVAGLREDGFDVSAFHPVAVGATDLSASRVVIAISTSLPNGAEVGGSKVEQWNDVPPASVDYGKARDSLKAHVEKLIEQLSQPPTARAPGEFLDGPHRTHS